MSDTKEASAALEHDAAELKKLGYEQELHRHMGGFSNFAIYFSITCILAGDISAFPLALGGCFYWHRLASWRFICSDCHWPWRKFLQVI